MDKKTVLKIYYNEMMLISDDWQSDFQLVPYIIKDVGV